MFAAKEAVRMEKLMKLSMLKLSPELGVQRAVNPDGEISLGCEQF